MPWDPLRGPIAPRRMGRSLRIVAIDELLHAGPLGSTCSVSLIACPSQTRGSASARLEVARNPRLRAAFCARSSAMDMMNLRAAAEQVDREIAALPLPSSVLRGAWSQLVC